jgi:hypothetical protein
MKSRTIADAFSWLACFLVFTCWFRLTDWWAAQACPRFLNRETIAVAVLAAACWVAIRAVCRSHGFEERSVMLSLGFALLLPFVGWMVGWSIAWFTFVPHVNSPSVPRVFTLVPLVLAALARGLGAHLLPSIPTGQAGNAHTI